ncbi:MAG TPA: hypothetical protein VF712_14970 [Thermoleophilaceae bacterium]
MKSVRRTGIRRGAVALGAAAAMAALPAPASAAPSVGDYSCEIASLSVQDEFLNGSSGPFSAGGSGSCWTDDPNQKVATQFSASGTYRAQKCSLISVAQPSYLTLTGTLTLAPSGASAVSTGVTITTADVATSNSSAGTITLGSGQTGPVTVRYANPVLGVIERCGGDPFRPTYSGRFLAR